MTSYKLSICITHLIQCMNARFMKWYRWTHIYNDDIDDDIENQRTPVFFVK